MTDVDRLILEAWQKLSPKILANPDELNKRLARRRAPVLTRPPRAWCIAIRACDRRITPAHWIITPEHAMDLNHPDHPYEPIEHEVTIQTHAIRRYCHPIRIAFPGEEVDEVARRLGVAYSTMVPARHAGIFSERSYKLLGGKPGKPVPVIFSEALFDPGFGRFRAPPHRLWGASWEFLSHLFPDQFEQTVLRKPRFGIKGKNPTGEVYKDETQHIGWSWACPACKKSARTIYFPLPVRSIFDKLGYDPISHSDRDDDGTRRFLHDDARQLPQPTFACADCHQVKFFIGTTADGWNDVVSHLSEGLLYGREVSKPPWYRKERKRARSRQIFRAAPKREAVFQRLRNGWTLQQIAKDMLVSMSTVYTSVHEILRQERVKNRRELAAKLAWKHEQPLNDFEKRIERARQREAQVLTLILEGRRLIEIAAISAVNVKLVRKLASRIYKQHGLTKGQGRPALAQKFGLTLPRRGTGILPLEKVGQSAHATK